MANDPNAVRITDDQNRVAIGYYQPVYKQAVLRNGHSYMFDVHKVSMAWVLPEDVDEVLRIPYGCCGHTRTGAFFIANQLYVDIFLGRDTGGRR